MHKIAIFSDELEIVKQLNFSLQKFERQNRIWKSVLIYIIVYRKKYVFRGFLLAKKQESVKSTWQSERYEQCIIDYLKSINKNVGTANSGKEFLEITVNNKWRKIKEFKSKAETALWFVESYGLVPQYLKLESTDGQTVKVDFNPSSSKSSYQNLPEEERQKIKDLLFILEKNNVSESAYRELTVFCDGLPRTYLVSSSMPGRY